MIKTKVAFLEGRLLSSQSEQPEKFSKSPDWLEKSRPSKKATFVLIMIVNRLMITSFGAGFLSRLFSSQSKVIKLPKRKKEKKIGWKKASIESRLRLK